MLQKNTVHLPEILDEIGKFVVMMMVLILAVSVLNICIRVKNQGSPNYKKILKTGYGTRFDR